MPVLWKNVLVIVGHHFGLRRRLIAKQSLVFIAESRFDFRQRLVAQHSNDILVASIINDIPQTVNNSTIISAVDRDDQKLFYLPSTQGYTIKITARDTCKVTYSVNEFSRKDMDVTRIVNYFEIDMQKGETVVGLVENLTTSPDAIYPLTLNGNILTPSEDLSDFNAISYEVSVNINGEGYVNGVGSRNKGDFAKLSAIPNDGYCFSGWYLNNAKISSELSYRFCVLEDITLEARFIRLTDTVTPTPIPSYSSGYKTSPAEPPVITPTPVSPADALYKLGLFVGTGTDANGKPTYELDKKLTRLEALALVIRLMGQEKEAMAYSGANPFTDVPAWGDKYAAYGYHAGITVGVNNEHTLLASERQVTFQEFTAFLLRVLGYTEASGDFRYEDAIQKASVVGMFNPYDVSKISTTNFLRGNAVLQMSDALLTKPKGGDVLLLYKLADNGIFSKENADWFVENIK